MRKELAKDAERNRRDVLVSLLEVVDNLDRAIDAAQERRDKDAGDPLLQGVEMVRQQFLAKLDGFGVKRIEALGAEFDPLLHEAVTTVPAPDAAAEGRVVGVIAHGYRIGDEILRPALVAVGKDAHLRLKSLLNLQDGDRIDARRARAGHERGGDRRDGEQRRDAGEDGRVTGLDVIEERPQQPGGEDRARRRRSPARRARDASRPSPRRRSTCPARAPSATRIPISRVRCVTT